MASGVGISGVGISGVGSKEHQERINRLNEASLRRIIEPDIELEGHVGGGAVLPPELLSVAELGLELNEDQLVKLSREELASILDAGIRFESLLMAGFGFQLGWRANLADPRVTYLFHEIGEETRHSRLFVRLLSQLEPTAVNPLTHGLIAWFDQLGTRFALGKPALFCVMVLAGEEAPDLLQRIAVDNSGTDPLVRQVNRYHRAEEARHLAYARTVLPEMWASASPLERWVIRWLAPIGMHAMFDTLVHPGVYATVGLPRWRTWNAVRKSSRRAELKAEAYRPILSALSKIGAFGTKGRVPRPWRKLCQVGRS